MDITNEFRHAKALSKQEATDQKKITSQLAHMTKLASRKKKLIAEILYLNSAFSEIDTMFQSEISEAEIIRNKSIIYYLGSCKCLSFTPKAPKTNLLDSFLDQPIESTIRTQSKNKHEREVTI